MFIYVRISVGQKIDNTVVEVVMKLYLYHPVSCYMQKH